MQTWKRNLYLCWIGSFLTAAGMNLVIPFLPLYITELGETNHIEIWSSLAFSSTFLTAAIFSPIWGKLSDRFGRKPMLLRASLGMSIIMMMIGFATSAFQLVLLRFLMGAIAGFIPAAVILVASQTPDEESGRALGLLSTGGVAGTLIGPVIGGLLADLVGFRQVFWITGALLLISFIVSLFLVETSSAEKRKKKSINTVTVSNKEFWGLTLSIFVTTFILQSAMMSMQPILTLYVESLGGPVMYISLLAGIVTAISGVSNMISAPYLGKLGDRIGPQRVLNVCLAAVAVLIACHAFVSNIWVLIVLRFLLGFGLGGLLPAVNSLLKKRVPDAILGKAYGYNQTFQYMGGVAGPIIGGIIGGSFGLPVVFIVSSTLLLVNALFVFSFRKRTIVVEQQVSA
ncbi:MFS transporter [Bacillus sp. AGMB 02131]|uniref:MFS transporter n=1 Tax=Peribacillus faecalis TaxID=2772559 RepID=A0A927CU33_9BACI|nr:MFS transporter [Peribacillus faecalis]MBD3107852.1 MFS transporter [Peribacillus faecalis]